MKRQRFQIKVGEREHEVSVESMHEDGAVVVKVGEHTFTVQPGPGGTSLVRDAEGSAQQLVTLDGQARPRWAAVGGRPTKLEVQTEQEAALAAALAGGAGSSGAGSVEAPMPGRVVKLLVEAGATVEAGDPVIIVEAMKMENELHAPAAGTVGEFRVQAGDTVDAGQLLVDITPQDDDAPAS